MLSRDIEEGFSEQLFLQNILERLLHTKTFQIVQRLFYPVDTGPKLNIQKLLIRSNKRISVAMLTIGSEFQCLSSKFLCH